MINAVRTLLLNLSSSTKPGYDYPGEVFVPDGYKAITLPSYLETIRGILFSRDPDRLYMNYRLAQYMTLLHSTPLEDYVLEFDNRVSYLPISNNLFDVYKRPATVTQIAGTAKTFYVLGDVYSQTDRDKLYGEWRVEVLDGTTASVTNVIDGTYATNTYTSSASISSVLPLHGSDLTYRFQTGTGSKWQITLVKKPTEDLGTVLFNLALIDSEEVSNALFGNPPSGNYSVWRDLWQQHDELAYRLGGVLLAVASRTNELITQVR